MSRAPEWRPVNKAAAAASHWLVEVAGGAKLSGAERLTLEPQIGLADAWVTVARGCGISEDDLARHVATRYKIGIADLATATPLAPRRRRRAAIRSSRCARTTASWLWRQRTRRISMPRRRSGSSPVGHRYSKWRRLPRCKKRSIIATPLTGWSRI